MNKQKKPDISVEEACTILKEKYPEESFITHYMDYYAYPEVFSNTGGPFAKVGGLYGQAFTTFTIEAWVHGKHAVLFCSGKVFKTVDNWEGIGGVRL